MGKAQAYAVCDTAAKHAMRVGVSKIRTLLSAVTTTPQFYPSEPLHKLKKYL